MAKHGEYALFWPLKFEKNEKKCKSSIGELNPDLLGGSLVCIPLDHGDRYGFRWVSFYLNKCCCIYTCEAADEA